MKTLFILIISLILWYFIIKGLIRLYKFLKIALIASTKRDVGFYKDIHSIAENTKKGE